MPEGDTIHYAANRIRPVLEGHVPDEIATPHPRFGRDRWPERLAGRAVRSVDAHGKHLFLRFEGGLTIHSHLRMTGSWGVCARAGAGAARRAARGSCCGRGEHEVVQFDGPVLELMTESRTRFDQRLAGLGPGHPRPRARRGARSCAGCARTTRRAPIGDALLDQRTIAGIGNLWKVEGCFAAGIDPWRPAGEVSDEEALAIVREPRPRMQESAARRHAGPLAADLRPRGPPVPALRRRASRRRGQGDDNRTDVLVPELPDDLRRDRPQGRRPHRAGQHARVASTRRSPHGVDMIEFDVLPERLRRPTDGRAVLAHDYEHDLAAAR